jgi:hypothetical protein
MFKEVKNFNLNINSWDLSKVANLSSVLRNTNTCTNVMFCKICGLESNLNIYTKIDPYSDKTVCRLLEGLQPHVCRPYSLSPAALAKKRSLKLNRQNGILLKIVGCRELAYKSHSFGDPVYRKKIVSSFSIDLDGVKHEFKYSRNLHIYFCVKNFRVKYVCNLLSVRHLEHVRVNLVSKHGFEVISGHLNDRSEFIKQKAV